MSITVGIDLGTTYTVVSYYDKSRKESVIIKNKNGNNTTPSVIGFHADGTYVIGEDAKAMEEAGDVNTASFYKLHMGQNYKYEFYGKEYYSRDLSAMFLKRLIDDMQKNVNDRIKEAVITVPAYFEDAARNDTIKAGEKAGLKVLNIINEPTAACIAFGINQDRNEKKILIYDLGGGTFDVTIASVKNSEINVIATGGHHQLGGRDWDIAICEWLKSEFLDKTGIDLSGDDETIATLMISAEKAKKQLTSTNKTDISIDNGDRKIKVTLTRELFEQLTDYQLTMTTDIIDELFEEKNLTWRDISGAVLVGGSTKMPMVRNYITEHQVPIISGVHPDEAVSIGASIQAIAGTKVFALEGRKPIMALEGIMTISDVISHSLGMISISADGQRFVNDIMIPRNTPIKEAHETKQRELRVRRNSKDNHLDIYLLQGESEDPSDCTIAKKYVFNNVSYVDGGKTLINITYKHTVNGTIDISAVQTETGKKLVIKEEPIPEDMSWISKSPEDVFPKPVVSGLIVLAVDVSGSMYGEAMKKAKAAMKNFIKQFSDKNFKFAIMAFADSVQLFCSPTDDEQKLFNAIDKINECCAGGGNSASPLNEMYKIIGKEGINSHNTGNNGLLSHRSKRAVSSDAFAYSIVLTDGMWSSSACKTALDDKKLYVDNGYDVIGLGFGSADLGFLKSISTKEDLASVGTVDTLDSSLSSIARIISN